LVLVHAFSLDTRMWDDQVEAFAERYMVVRYDLRGFGRSAPGSERYSHASDLKALLDHLGLDRVALLGLSMGGGAVINFTIAYPEMVRALITVDSSLGGFAFSQQFASEQIALRETAN